VFREGLTNGFALYEPLKNLVGSLEISHFSFGILDLTAIPKQGWMLILPALAAGSQLIQAKMMSSKTGPSAASAAMNATTFILPAITLFFTMSLPAALSLYWITTTIFAIVQQIVLDKTEFKEEVIEVQHVLEEADKKKK
jgi:membrane protein insertase Oxa1/YidC/SpoIIIJ